jgi:hypothetical protein
MAYRDRETEAHEFLEWIVEVKRTHMRGVGPGPVTTVVTGCAGYVLPGDWRPGEGDPNFAAWPATGRC